MTAAGSPQPTGTVEVVGGKAVVSLSRRFDAPAEVVWAAITDPDRLTRWIGHWTGDPTTGTVDFYMTAEGDGPAQPVQIRACEANRLLGITFNAEGGSWVLDLTLTEDGGATTLVFVQSDLDPAMAPSVGPGWEYYLDRMVAAETGGDVAAIAFEPDYYPGMAAHYDCANPGQPG